MPFLEKRRRLKNAERPSVLSQPIKLEPKLVPRIWGGRRFESEFGRQLNGQAVGESWEIHGELKIQGSDLTLDELCQQAGQQLLGSKVSDSSSFPLLTKWLDCRAWLSVQVHPDDSLAKEYTKDDLARGKTEAWYIYRTSSESELIHGLAEGKSWSEIEGSNGNDILPYLNRFRPKEGQLLHTPAGTVHALGPSNLLYEVQQSCDLTYRFFDWGRGRPVHFERALDCARRSVPVDGVVSESRLSCPYFSVEVLSQACAWSLDGQSFQILVATSNGATLSWKGGEFNLICGESILLPASFGDVELTGDFVEPVLRIGIP